MNYFDFVVLATVLFSGIFSYYRGLLKELASVTKWLVASYVALSYYKNFSVYFLSFVWDSPGLANILTGIALFLGVLVFFTVVLHLLSFPTFAGPIRFLDKILGFFFGAGKVVLIFALIHFSFFRFYDKWPLLIKDGVLTPYLGELGSEIGEKLIQHNVLIKGKDNKKGTGKDDNDSDDSYESVAGQSKLYRNNN